MGGQDTIEDETVALGLIPNALVQLKTDLVGFLQQAAIVK